MPPALPTATCGVSPQVFIQAASGKPSPRDCTIPELFEIVIDAARRYRTGKEEVEENKDYILRLKTEVFKVRFGSVGVRVRVTYRDEEGRLVTRKMIWNEFCALLFGVTADWVNRLCGGKAEGRRQAARGRSKPLKLDNRQQAALVKAQVAANELVAALRAGADWRTPLAEYERVAVTPARLDAFLSALSPEPDWKAVAVKLVYALDQCADGLPAQAKDALNAAKDVLAGNPDGQKSLPSKPPATKKPHEQATISEGNKQSPAAPTISYPGGKARLASTLVDYMPREGRSYLEPFAGLGNVFWAATSRQLRFQRWLLNDIRTAPFLEAVRDIGGTMEVPVRSPEEGLRQWEASKHGDPRAILLEPYLTFNGSGYGSGWRGKNGPTVGGYTRTLRACQKLLHATKATTTDCDWTDLDWASLTGDDFVFMDPPYIGAEVRSYKENDIDHEELVRLLKSAKFRWMLTEYPNELYYRELGQPFFVQDVQLNAVNFQVTGGQGTPP
jgi:16S rRNA G966 N2-methylase RsmD